MTRAQILWRRDGPPCRKPASHIGKRGKGSIEKNILKAKPLFHFRFEQIPVFILTHDLPETARPAGEKASALHIHAENGNIQGCLTHVSCPKPCVIRADGTRLAETPHACRPRERRVPSAGHRHGARFRGIFIKKRRDSGSISNVSISLSGYLSARYGKPLRKIGASPPAGRKKRFSADDFIQNVRLPQEEGKRPALGKKTFKSGAFSET